MEKSDLVMTVFITSAISLMVLYETYLLIIKKKDRGFWQGLIILSCIVLAAGAARYYWDSYSKSTFTNQLGYESSIINKKYLNHAFPEYDFSRPKVCTIQSNLDSSECLFLAGMWEEELLMVDVISNSSEVQIRYGKWPFHKVMSFKQN